MEIADAILINKAEGEGRQRAELARRQYVNALHLLKPKSANWQVPVLLCSALHHQGIDAAWQTVMAYREAMQASGEFDRKRRLQATDWMWTLVIADLKDLFLRDKNVEALLAKELTTPSAAARRLLEAFKRH
jgi:LAO/AO transport system kinase